MSMSSFVFRLGQQSNAKRNRVAMSERTDYEILRAVTGSHQAADSLIVEFKNLKSLAEHGGRFGFGSLHNMPGVSWAVVGKLEAWLESLGRVTA
jgi:hypothetical protein